MRDLILITIALAAIAAAHAEPSHEPNRVPAHYKHIVRMSK